MQLSRARRLSSDRTMYHGACLLSVAFSIISRAREYSSQRRYDSTSIGLSFHCRSGSLIRAENRRSCSSLPTFAIDDVFFDLRAKLEKTSVLLLRAKSHNVFDAGAVVPAAIEDHDLAACRELLDVALHEHLCFLTIRGGRQGHHPIHPRAHALGDSLDGSTLAGGIAPFEHDDDARSRFFDPILQMTKLDL